MQSLVSVVYGVVVFVGLYFLGGSIRDGLGNARRGVSLHPVRRPGSAPARP